ncbi:acetate--CoA ligase family protein [Nocardia sp. NPDC127606]|uniref:acetate--CoA ligase family protein n=1 Tax=Nocardia sp. NPDC127606 TaxID=3345406 RepID=UPI00362E5815
MTLTDDSSTPADRLSHVVEQAMADGSTMVDEASAKQVLRAAGVSVPSGRSATTFEQLRVAAAELKTPLVLKAVSPTVVHKSDLGAVVVGLHDANEVVAAARRMADNLRAAGHEVSGFLLEEMAEPGQELVVGAVRRDGLGWIVMVGIGGIFVELIGDVTFAFGPLERAEIRRMIRSLRGKGILEGARGRPPVDVEGLVSVVEQLAGPRGLLSHAPAELLAVDLNPVIVSASGATAVDARFIVGAPGSAVDSPPQLASDFQPLFGPRTIAVAGASSKKTNAANMFIRNTRDFGFDGSIFPLHVTADEIEGLPAYRDVASLPADVDYLYVALPGAAVADLLETGAGRVKFAQIVSSGFGETADGGEKQQALVDAARRSGTRIIGPNCVGTHSSRGRLTFIDEVDPVEGGVCVVSQSGGLAIDILRLGSSRGLQFNSVVSLGNGADVSPAELVRHHLDDPAVSVIGLYLESLAEAKAVMDVALQGTARKPIVLLAGGRTSSGARAASSHTGALMTDHTLWPVLARQSGFVLVDTLSELVNALLAFQFRDAAVRPVDNEVVLFGNGGGSSVLATDALERVGLSLADLEPGVLEKLTAVGLEPGSSLVNPIDAPAPAIAARNGQVAEDVLREVMNSDQPPAAMISHLNVGVIASHTGHAGTDAVESIITAIGQVRADYPGRSHHGLVLRSDGRPATEQRIREYRSLAGFFGLPVFDEIAQAVGAIAALISATQEPHEEGNTL